MEFNQYNYTILFWDDEKKKRFKSEKKTNEFKNPHIQVYCILKLKIVLDSKKSVLIIVLQLSWEVRRQMSVMHGSISVAALHQQEQQHPLSSLIYRESLAST